MNELPEAHRQRQVRSFVLRSGRMTPSQQKAFDELWPKYGLYVTDGLLDFSSVFQRNGNVVLEIGFGMGDSLIEMALAHPDTDFIGIEVHRPGVGRLLNNIDRHKLTNIRVYCDDAIEVLERCIPESSLARVQIFFPDPWHKKKHHKRRIIQIGFIEMLCSKLAQQGVIHLATDWQDYAEHMMEVLSTVTMLENMAGGLCYSERPPFRPITKFEKRGQRLGHGVWDLLFRLN